MRALLPLLLLACATQPKAPAPRERSIITAEELMATHVSNLYQAIQQIRPEFLHDRGYSSIQSPRVQLPVVYVDNIPMGDIDFLQSMSTADVAEVRKLSAEEATTRWGTGHVGGAILVTTHAMRVREQ
jgi:hypothetical protein